MAISKFSTIVDGYLAYQKDVRKLKHRTVVDIKCTMNNLNKFCTEIGISKDLFGLSLPEYIRWVNKLRDDGVRQKVVNKMLSHVRGLIDYAWQLERVDRNVLVGFFLKEPEETKLYDYLSIEEAEKLIKSFSNKTANERRMRLVMLILYGCGLRTSELCNLNVEDINLETQEVKILGKGDKERLVPIADALLPEIILYLNDLKRKRGPLFKSPYKKVRINGPLVSEIIRLAVTRSQINKDVTPRTIRHAFASHLLNQGVDIAVISMLMGHNSPSETGVYIHAEEKDLKNSKFLMTE